MEPDDKKVTYALYGVIVVLVLGIAWLVSGWTQVPVAASTTASSGQVGDTASNGASASKSIAVSTQTSPASSSGCGQLSGAGVVFRVLGVVEPLHETELASSVTGFVEWISPELTPGGKFLKGQEMLKVGKLEYQARLSQVKADLEEKRLEMAEEKAQALNSVSSWVGDKSHKQGSSSDLVVRLPHRRALSARVEAMEAEVKIAEAALEKTTIVAPYDCVIASRLVDKGSRLQDGTPVAALFSMDDRILRVPVPIKNLEQLGWSSDGNSDARVLAYIQVGGIRYQWDGCVDRLEGSVNPRSSDMMLVARIGSNESNPVNLRVAPVGLSVQVELLPVATAPSPASGSPTQAPEGRPAGEPCPPVPASAPPGVPA